MLHTAKPTAPLNTIRLAPFGDMKFTLFESASPKVFWPETTSPKMISLKSIPLEASTGAYCAGSRRKVLVERSKRASIEMRIVHTIVLFGPNEWKGRQQIWFVANPWKVLSISWSNTRNWQSFRNLLIYDSCVDINLCERGASWIPEKAGWTPNNVNSWKWTFIFKPPHNFAGELVIHKLWSLQCERLVNVKGRFYSKGENFLLSLVQKLHVSNCFKLCIPKCSEFCL